MLTFELGEGFAVGFGHRRREGRREGERERVEGGRWERKSLAGRVSSTIKSAREGTRRSPFFAPFPEGEERNFSAVLQ